MGAIWIVGELGADGGLARISAEAATLARELGAAAGREVVGIVVAADPDRIAEELAGYVPVVWSVTDPSAAEHAWSAIAATHIASLLTAAGDGAAGAPPIVHPMRCSSGRDPTDATWPARSRP